jgi:hypothetical protein
MPPVFSKLQGKIVYRRTRGSDHTNNTFRIQEHDGYHICCLFYDLEISVRGEFAYLDLLLKVISSFPCVVIHLELLKYASSITICVQVTGCHGV